MFIYIYSHIYIYIYPYVYIYAVHFSDATHQLSPTAAGMRCSGQVKTIKSHVDFEYRALPFLHVAKFIYVYIHIYIYIVYV